MGLPHGAVAVIILKQQVSLWGEVEGARCGGDGQRVIRCGPDNWTAAPLRVEDSSNAVEGRVGI